MRAVLKPRRVGRYLLFEAFARGGMATVHLGRLIADRGFSRLVAVKMLTPGQAGSSSSSSAYARALEEEARIASRIRHPNVVQPLDFVVDGDDLFVVMEYVHGVALSQLVGAARRTLTPLPFPVTGAILSDVLNGLHAAHEATDEHGRVLGVVHRDVSPQNVLVGADGVARLADFGIAKVMRRSEMEQTEAGTVKGKLAYMAPEQLRGLPLTRQADIFSAGAVLAEALSGLGPDANDEDPTAWLASALRVIKPHEALLDVVRTATRSDPRDRFATAAEMGIALAHAVVCARADTVADRVTDLAGDDLEIRSELVRRVEAAPLDSFSSASSTSSASSARSSLLEDDEELAPPTPRVLPTPITPVETIEPIEPIEIIDPSKPIVAPVPAFAAASHRSAPRPQSQSQSPSRQPLVIALAAVIAVLGVIIYLRRGESGPPPSSSPAPVWPAASPLPTGPVVEAPRSSGVLSSSVPVLSSAPTPGTTPPKPTIRHHPPTTTTPSTPRPTAKPDCNPPFRIDGDGNKHYKPECVVVE